MELEDAIAPNAERGTRNAEQPASTMTSPLLPRDAALTILSHVRRQPSLRVPLDEALGGVLAEEIVSRVQGKVTK